MLIRNRNRVVAAISRLVLVVAGILLISLGLSPTVRAEALSVRPIDRVFGGSGIGGPAGLIVLASAE